MENIELNNEFEEPSLEIVLFETDIITTSGENSISLPDDDLDDEVR